MPLDTKTDLRLPDEALKLLGLTAAQTGTFAAGSVTVLDTQKGAVWLKVLAPKPRRPLQSFLRGLINFLPAPAMARTPSGKGGDTLLRQAEQADILRRAGFNAPETIFVDHNFLITPHAGTTLETMRKDLAKGAAPGISVETFHSIICAATAELARLHAAGFAHGRPKLRDIAWNKTAAGDGQIVFMDLEERPWETMPIADAQARDILLWLIDLCSNDGTRNTARSAAETLCGDAPADVLTSLQQAVRSIGPFEPAVRFLLRTRFSNREIRGGVAAFAILKHQLQPARGGLESPAKTANKPRTR